MARLALLIGLLAAAVAAAAPAEQPGLEDILQVGSSRAHGHLKWGLPKAQVQQMFPEGRPGIPPYDEPDSFGLQTYVSDHGCRYDVYLRGLTGGVLTGIELRYAGGIAPERCRAQLEHRLIEIYGSAKRPRRASPDTIMARCMALLGDSRVCRAQMEHLTRAPANAPSPPRETKTTCIALLGERPDTGPFDLNLGDVKRHDCGHPDQVVNAQSQTAEQELRAIETSLDTEGVAQTLKTWFDCDSGKGYSLVASGDSRAVDMAFRLLRQSDACFSEQLMSSLATALASKPDIVLNAYAHQSWIFERFPDEFCVPFMDAEATSKETVLRTLNRIRQTLERVARPDLQHVKQACLDAVARYTAHVNSH